MRKEEKYYPIAVLSLLALFWVYRLIVLLNAPYDLYLDEAYYYNWALNPDFGYYSKPPMLAWLIFTTTSLFGDSQVAIKIGSMILYPITIYVIYLIAKALFDQKVALYAAMVFFTLPSIWMSSLIISTDVVLLLFWSLSLLFFIKALYHDKAGYWVLTGIFSGLGLLSKYNFIFFLLSVLMVLIFIPRFRKHLTNRYFYMTIMIAFLIFLPNLLWNYNNDFVSFSHTADISKVSQTLIHPSKFLEFFGAQFLVFGPILFFMFWVMIFKRAIFKNERYVILFAFAIVTLGIIMILSFLSRAYANWAAVTYVSATILVVAYLIEMQKERLLKISIVIHTLLAILFFHYQTITQVAGIVLTKKTDPYNRVSGWSGVAEKIAQKRRAYPDALLLTTGRREVAQFDYYMKEKFFIWNPNKQMDNHYHLTRDLNNQKGENFLLIASPHIGHDTFKAYFESVENVATVSEALYSDYNRSYVILYVQNFKGY